MKKTNVLKLIVVSALAIIIAVASSSMSLGATYNYNTTNILDNLTKDGNTLYIPYIFSKPTDTLTVAKVTNNFTAKGLTIKSINRTGKEANNSIVGTGTTITVNQNTSVYNILIYGDVDGSGEVDVFDALSIGFHATRGGNYTLSGIYLKAANLDNTDNEITVFDALNAGFFATRPAGSIKLVEQAPTINPPDTTKPVINSTYSSKTINHGDAYNIMDGITATDNMDGTITNKVAVTIKYNNTTVSSFDSTKVGTYTLTYNVSDNAGNAATAVTRTVTVQDPVQSISVSGYKATYIYGDDFSAIGTISVTRSSGVSNVALSEAEISGYNKNQLGEQIITVTYGGKSTTFNVTVNDAITGITVIAPTKVTYAYNEDIDLTGATYTTVMKSGAAGTTSDVTAAMISGYNKTTVGEQTITVTYEGKTATFTVTVQDSALATSIEVAEIGDTDVRLEKSVIRAITIKNETDAEISLKARYLTVTNTQPTMISIVLLGANSAPINDENQEDAKFVKIEPLEGATIGTECSFTIAVDEAVAVSNSVTTGSIAFTINDKAKLNSITAPSSITISRSGTPITLNLALLDQDGQEMGYDWLLAGQIGNYSNTIAILSPTTTEGDDALVVKCYNANNEEVTGESRAFTRIELSAAFNDDDPPATYISTAGLKSGDDKLIISFLDPTNAREIIEIPVNIVD